MRVASSRLSRVDIVVLVALAVMAAATLYEAAVALQWIPVGDVPDEGARFEWFFLIAGGLAMLTGLVVCLFLGAEKRRSTPGVALGAVAAALVAAHAYTFDTYLLPSLVRYTDSGTLPSATWVAGVVAAGLLSSLFSLMYPAIGFVATAVVMSICIFTFWFTGCCN
jgi:hypothetical protein